MYSFDVSKIAISNHISENDSSSKQFSESSSRVVALVRHGETDWNTARRFQGRTDIPLNQFGLEQAADTGKILAKRRWDAIVSSPLSRARKTAEIISQIAVINPFSINEGLVEQGFGDAEGVIAADMGLYWPDGEIPGKETKAEVISRAKDAWEEIIETPNASRIVVVCHGAVIRYLCEELLGIDPGIIANGGIEVLRETNGVWQRSNVFDD